MDYTCMNRILNDHDFPESRKEIRTDQPLPIAASRGMVVRGEHGTAWLTQEGRLQDYILIPGAEYLSPDDRKIVVSSVGGSATIAVFRARPGYGGFSGSPLRVGPAAIARIRREARGAPARMIGEWIARFVASARKLLRPLERRVRLVFVRVVAVNVGLAPRRAWDAIARLPLGVRSLAQAGDSDRQRDCDASGERHLKNCRCSHHAPPAPF